MRVLILNGSPRPNGNTKQMIRAFCEGLEKAGHAFNELDICRMNVHGCLACEYCHGKGNGQCVQKDDMGKVYHRFYATLYPKKAMKLSKIAMLLVSGDADMYDGAMFSYQGDFLDYLGLEDMGVITAQAYAPDIPAEKIEEIRRFGASL